MKLKRPPALLVHLMSLLLSVIPLFALCSMQAPVAFAKATATPSYVRVIHASPDVGTANVFLDGASLLSSFQFGSVTDYAPIPPGPHNVQVALVGKGPGAAVITQTLAVSPGVAYTVAAIGTNVIGLSLEVFVDNNILDPGMAKVRVYHLSPNVGPFSVASGNSTIISDVSYQQASAYLKVPVGPYTFNVHPTNVNTTVSISTMLNANMVTSIFAVGMFNGSPNLRLVSTQVKGLPNLPGTGSDPNAIPAHSQPQLPSFPWLPGVVILVLIGASGVLIRRRAAAR